MPEIFGLIVSIVLVIFSPMVFITMAIYNKYAPCFVIIQALKMFAAEIHLIFFIQEILY
jgi:hypothetical protein